MLKDHIHQIRNCMQHACNSTMPSHIHEPILCMLFPPYTEVTSLVAHSQHVQLHFSMYLEARKVFKFTTCETLKLDFDSYGHYKELVGGTPSWPAHGTTPLEPVCNGFFSIMVSWWCSLTFVLLLHRVHKLLQIKHLHMIRLLSF